MTRREKRGARATKSFFFVLLLGCFCAWLTGYDFDSRSPIIALGAFITGIAALMVAVAVEYDDHDDY